MLFHTHVACNYSKSNAKVMMANYHLSVVQPSKISAYKVCVRMSATCNDKRQMERNMDAFYASVYSKEST